MTYQAPCETYQGPPRKRGLKRIIVGFLGLVANGIGLVVLPVAASLVVASFTILPAS